LLSDKSPQLHDEGKIVTPISPFKMKQSFVYTLHCVLFCLISHSTAFTSLEPSSPVSKTSADAQRIPYLPSSTLSQRRDFISQITIAIIPVISPKLSHATESSTSDVPFHSTAYGQEEYTNSIVASRDTNISPREVYDTIASDYLKNVLDMIEKGGGGVARALDVGAGK